MGKSSHLRQNRDKEIGLKQALKLFCFALLLLPVSALAEFDHSQWDSLLRKHVKVQGAGVATQLDYAGMAGDQAQLSAYLAALAAVDRPSFEVWDTASQLAFLINTYNALTVDLILDDYPDIDSIRDIGFLLSSAWNQDIASLFREPVTLDEIEHEMIRGWDRYKEPRIHFAVNCAAIGCPALRNEAYVSDRLERQLEESTKLFLSDRSRNYFDNGRLYVSSIFDWYEEDFERGWGGIDSVAEFLANYPSELGLDGQTVDSLRAGNLRIRYLRYDWDLNDVP